MTKALQEYSDSFGKEIAEMKDVIKRFLQGEVSAETVNATNDRCFTALDVATEKYHRDFAKEVAR